MGNILGQDEKQLNQSLKGQYKIQTHPYLLHRETNQLCLCHKITTNTATNSNRIDQIIQQYKRSRCASISTLKTWHHLDKTGYCSDQQTYYLIFMGQNNYTLKEQIIKRRFYQKPFKEHEIRNIIETYLCGLRQYHQRFEREYERLGLDSLVLDQPSQRIYLKDPWLGLQPETQNGNKMTHLMQSYPSPQKLNVLLSPRISTYSEFLSNLFSVGVISLELKCLDFADSIYTKKKQVNRDEINRRVYEFRDSKLRMGIQLLLSEDPNQRKQIFTMWGIENKEEHFLVPINEDQNMEEIHKNRQNKQYQERPQQQNLVLHRPSQQNPQQYQHQIRIEPQRDLTQTNKIMFNSVQPSTIQPSTQYRTRQVNFAPKAQPQHMQMSAYTGPARPTTNISFNNPSPAKININAPPTYVRPNSQQTRPWDIKKFQPPKTQRLHAPPSRFQMVQQNNKSNQIVLPEKKSEGHSRYLSFQDYFNADKKPMLSNHINTNTNQNNYISRPRSTSQNTTLQFKKRSPSQSQPVEISKESFSLNLGNNSSQQNSNDNYQSGRPSPIVEIEKYVKEEKKNQTPKQTNAVVSEETSPNKARKQQQTVENSAEISPVKAPTAQIDDAQVQTRNQEEQKQEKPVTPRRPTSKNKYNSTIVEVKDEDTPEHSNKSEDPGDEEYVVQQYETGSKYEGFKSRGMRNGKGRFYYQDGGYYEGNWKNNKMDGFGKLYYEGGKMAYEGMWSQDQFNGLGKVYNDNPVVLSGTFDYTNFDYLEDYWEYYEGMLSKDTKQGRGRIKLSNGQVFEGDFHEDKIQGFGKFHNLEGKTIEGMWRDSKLIKVINSS